MKKEDKKLKAEDSKEVKKKEFSVEEKNNAKNAKLIFFVLFFVLLLILFSGIFGSSRKNSEDLNLEATFIIPVNNRPDFISTAIESILEKTIQNIEIIVVVNGGSEDPTNKTVKQYMPGGKNYKPDNNALQS